MSTMTDQQNAVEMVRRGYDDATRCLHFLVGFPSTLDFDGTDYRDVIAPAALEAIRVIDSYNDFDGEAVAQAVEDLAGVCKIMVGRQNSVVLYIEVPSERHREHAEKALRDVCAEELDWTGYTLRAWWE